MVNRYGVFLQVQNGTSSAHVIFDDQKQPHVSDHYGVEARIITLIANGESKVKTILFNRPSTLYGSMREQA